MGLRKVIVPNVYLLVGPDCTCDEQLQGVEAVELWLNAREEEMFDRERAQFDEQCRKQEEEEEVKSSITVDPPVQPQYERSEQ